MQLTRACPIPAITTEPAHRIMIIPRTHAHVFFLGLDQLATRSQVISLINRMNSCQLMAGRVRVSVLSRIIGLSVRFIVMCIKIYNHVIFYA